MGLTIGGHNGVRVGEVKNVSIHGVPGCGIYVLYLQLSIIVDKLKSEAFVSQLICRLEHTETSSKIANGVIDGHPVTRFTEYTKDCNLVFFFYLSGSQLNAIELKRGNDDLKLSLWLSGVVDYESKTDSFFDKADYIIPKQQWLTALGAMRYKDTLLFELPMPSSKATDKLKTCLEKAHSHILNGHYKESVGFCRQAIELTEKDRGDKKAVSKAADKYKNCRQDMDVIERMLFLRESLKNITHLGVHDGDDFTRQQAQVVLGMTVAILSSAEIGIKQ